MDDKKYEEIEINYRFFLGWRHAAFAGNLVIIYGVLSLTFSVFKEQPAMAWIVPALGFPIGILLWIIDVRTRDLYHAAIRAGKELEGKEGGFFSQLSGIVIPKDASAFRKLSQSAALNILFLGSSVALLILAILLFIWSP